MSAGEVRVGAALAGPVRTIDQRARPGGPPRVGDRVSLWVDVETGLADGEEGVLSRGLLVALEVTADLGGGRYRGELLTRPDPGYLPPASVRIGQPFAFTAGDVARIEDGPAAARDEG